MPSSPLLTIAVCTYRRFDWLGKCLNSLRRQTLPADRFRIVVVDNSLKPAESKKFREALPPAANLEYIITEKAGLSYARNLALEKCKTPYIAYLDDDAIAAPDWAERILDTFARHHGAAGIVGGKVNPIYETQCPAWLNGELLLYLAIPDWGDAEMDLCADSGKWLVGAGIAYDTGLLRRTGGFPEKLGRSRDMLLCHEEFWVNKAIREMGASIVYNPSVVIDHLIQKERLTRRWLLEASYWEGVSWMVCCNPGVVADFAAIGPSLKTELSRMLEAPHKPGSETEQGMIRECAVFKAAGRDAMRRHGMESDTPPPASRFPTLFLVTTCRNAADTIENSLRSILEQEGDFFLRYHVQDGNSTDDTVALLDRWRQGLADGSIPIFCRGVVFSYASARDSGMYDGIEKAFNSLDIPPEGFMTWLNADDRLFPGALATIATLQTDNPKVDWVTGEIYCTRETGGLCQTSICGHPRWMIQHGLCEGRFWQFIQQEGTFWRKRLWDAAGGLDTTMRLAGDFDLWRRFAAHADLWHFMGPLASFRRRSGQLSEDAGKYCAEIDRVVSLEQKEKDWKWLVGQFSANDEQFTVPILYYDWNTDEYKESFPFLRDYAPFWKRDLFHYDGSDGHAPGMFSQPPLSQEHRESSAPRKASAIRRSRPIPVPDSSICDDPAELQPLTVPDRPESRFAPLRKWRRMREYQIVRRSGLFFDAWYLERYPDVARLGIDPLLHYLRHGWAEGRNPSPTFKTAVYLRENPDVRASGVNPLLHYILHGRKEMRRTGAEPPPSPAASEAAPALTTAAMSGSGLPVSPDPPPEPTLGAFRFYTSARRFQLPVLSRYAEELFGHAIDFDAVTMSAYQDLLVYAFVKNNLPVGSNILEIGGGWSRVLPKLRTLGYKGCCCDPFEGIDNAPNDGDFNYRLVKARIGENPPALANASFDFAFSIGVLETLPADDTASTAFLADIRRVLKPGALHLHLAGIMAFDGWEWIPPPIEFMAIHGNPVEPLPRPTLVARDPDLYAMSESAYNTLWKSSSGKSYAEFGRPTSLALLLRNTPLDRLQGSNYNSVVLK